MESRLAATARANFRLLSGAFRHQTLRRGLATVPLPTRRVADPAIHSECPSESDTLVTARAAATAQEEEEEKIPHKPTKEVDPLVPPKPPVVPSPKLESPAVNQPIDPIQQQKRRLTTFINRAPIDELSCAALDDGPWPDDKEERQSQLSREEEDNKEYYEHHKASSLSEIELADTRKPITRATDGTVDSYVGEILDVVSWREEQLDTAEEALRRAMEIWKQSAMRGDPDSPHGRVLRALRREDW